MDQRRMWRLPGAGGLELMALYRSTHVFPAHAHDTFSIGVNLEGAHLSEARGGRHVIQPGAIAVLAPGVVHTGARFGDGPWSFFGLYPGEGRLSDVATDRPGGIPHFPRMGITDRELAARLVRLCRMLECARSELELEARVTDILADLVARHATGSTARREVGPEDARVATVIDFLEANLARNVTLAELAAIAGLSRYHFLRVFRGNTGLTPHAYRTQARIRRARRMLSGSEEISSIAFQLGFVDQSHLTRSFKRSVGVTPAEYRQAVR